MTFVTHQIRLAARPSGLPTPEVWDRTETEIGDPAERTFVVAVRYVSLDPAMRGWMNEGRSYVPPVQIGEVMRAFAGGEVVASAHPDFAVGDLVTGLFGVQTYAVSDGRGVQKLAPDADLPTNLAVLGMPGMTAYFGLFDVGALKDGETVLVSGAAGAVGSIVGQLAKIRGCRVIGIAGGPRKCAWLVDELGFDAAVDYRSADARVPICGAISQYNKTGKPTGPANYLSLLVNRARMEGFVVTDFTERYPEAAAAMTRWIAEGRLHSRHDVVRGGVGDFPDVLLRLFKGENTGKLLLELEGA
jgi:NADPH-dependent curcumin reductase CurA